MPRGTGVLDNALDAVGYTPLIRLDRIAKDMGLKCNLCAFVRLSGSWFFGGSYDITSRSGKSRVYVFWGLGEGQNRQTNG